jgi:carnitine-CoA ligase
MGALEGMFGIDVYAAFGMTETVTHAIIGRRSEGLPDWSMGHPAPGYEIAVVDKATGRLCGEDEPGELWVRGTRGIQLFLGYDGNPEANEQAFEDGWFKTGDVVRVGAGGNVFYQERDKDMLKVGGENVSAREVEQRIAPIPGVQAVAVVGRSHDFLTQVPVAFVVKAAGESEDELTARILTECESQLSTFKVPRAVYYLDEFPTGTLDKLQKNKLRDLAEQMPSLD